MAYTNSAGETVQRDVATGDAWALEAEPLGADTPFVAGYSHKQGNMAFVVRDFKGRLGGQDAKMFGLSVFGGTDWTELFLTAPASLEYLRAGDYVDASLFVMPYGHATVDHTPAQRQQLLYGPKAATLSVARGTKLGEFPLRLRTDERGFADFTVENGNNWNVVLMEGFKTYKLPMLWEQAGPSWLFHDQQVLGNDWYQSYQASDGTIGFAVAVKLRPDMSHRYVVSVAPNATAITQRNGSSPSGRSHGLHCPHRFAGLDCVPVDGTDLFRCTGSAESATMVGQ